MTSASHGRVRSAEWLSIVIPTLNAGSSLDLCLASLVQAEGADLVVIDAGSVDDTAEVVRRRVPGATLRQAPRGRGGQLRIGADIATRPWLLFLHADTRLQAGWFDEVASLIATPDAPRKAACFRFGLDDNDWRARLLETLVALRVALLGLPYGDQGVLVHRTLYRQLGGYRDLPLMEDVDLIRRLGSGRLHRLSAVALTSAVRWRRDGWIRRSVRNLCCLALFHLGVPPHRIVRLYER